MSLVFRFSVAHVNAESTTALTSSQTPTVAGLTQLPVNVVSAGMMIDMKFTFRSQKDGMDLMFTGYVDETMHAWTIEMFAAMREGLEANGFSCDGSLSFENTMPL